MVEGHLGVEQKTPGQSRMQSIEKAGVTSSWDFEVGGDPSQRRKGETWADRKDLSLVLRSCKLQGQAVK